MKTDQFDHWNENKKKLAATDLNNRTLFFREREIWWYACGINLGVEINGRLSGKVGSVEKRPVLIVKRYLQKDANYCSFIGLPLSTLDFKKLRSKGLDKYHYCLGARSKGKDSVVCLRQIRYYSAKRLLRKQMRVSEKQFNDIKSKLLRVLA